MSQEIKITLSDSLKPKPDIDSLGFGNNFTDHMFIMDYSTNKGWHNPQIKPYQNLSLDPATMVLHYGQAIFEGLKAYKDDKNKIRLFRPMENMNRINISNDRLCIPKIDPNFCLSAIKKLVSIEKEWIPTKIGTSLYIRPFIIATDPFLGVRPSHTYKFIVILSPVGAYYKEGINPVKIYVEDKYVRAVRGGYGYAKTVGNYSASLKAQVEAKEKGYTQVLWLDGVERKYIEEVGTMNIFFVINNKIVTPQLNGSILPGITRKSCIELLTSWNYEVEERKITIDELFDSAKKGALIEAFGTGTAAVISPVGQMTWKDNNITINNNNIGSISRKLYDEITGIQYGTVNDSLNWIDYIK